MHLNSETLWAVVNSIPYGVLIVDKDCKVVAVNDAYKRMFDETWENIVGKDYPALKKDSYLPLAIRAGKRTVNVTYKAQGCIHDYPGMGLAVTVFPLFQGKKIIGAAAVCRDISEPIESMQKYEQIAKRYGNVLRIQHHAKSILDDIIGESPAILRTKNEIRRVARGKSSVLLRGESGTGKELFASALHNASSRASEPFVPVNCPSLPETLAESELFGYEGGAFSGALKGGKVGFFEIVDGAPSSWTRSVILASLYRPKSFVFWKTGNFSVWEAPSPSKSIFAWYRLPTVIWKR